MADHGSMKDGQRAGEKMVIFNGETQAHCSLNFGSTRTPFQSPPRRDILVELDGVPGPSPRRKSCPST
jgi:hypothetical protein